MENISFNEIISFDENSKFKRINEANAVEYFLTCSDDYMKRSFLDKFAIYIKKGLEARGFTNNNMADLMFIIYNLYDDPFPLLVNFNQLIEDISSNSCGNYYKVNFSNIDTKKNIKNYFAIIDEIISEVGYCYSYSDFIISRELKKQLTMYRNDIEFAKRKDSFLKQYGNINEEKLKEAFDYYISKQYDEDGSKREKNIFLKDAGNNDKRRNRYEIYRYAYTYSLKNFGDEKTKKLFQLFGSKYTVAILESYDLNDVLSLKRGIASNIYHHDLYNLSLIIFGNGKYQDYLKNLYSKVNSSFEKDFEKVVLKYKQYIEEEKNYSIQSLLNIVDFQSFLDSDCKSIKDYCDSKGIKISVFKEALGYLKDEALLRQIEEKKQRLAGTRFAVINSKVDKIVDYMMNGVPLDDYTTREFDYLDYKLMTKLEFDDFKKLACNNGNADIVRAVSRFIGKNKNSRKTNIRSILNAKNIVGYGTENEHEITEEEKLATIDYLKQHHLVSKNGVIDSKVYNLAIKRYLAGTLFTEEEKDKIKNKS